jgi:hypothetical protein
VRDCVFRSVFSARNAEYQVRAMTIGSNIATLSPGETKLAGQISAKTTGLTRSWEYWSMRVAKKAGGDATAAKYAKAARIKAKPARAKTKPKRAAKARRR